MQLIDINVIAAKVAEKITVKAEQDWQNFVSEDGMEIDVDGGELFAVAFDQVVALSEASGEERDKLIDCLFCHFKVVKAMNEADMIVREAANDNAHYRRGQSSVYAQLREVGMKVSDFV